MKPRTAYTLVFVALGIAVLAFILYQLGNSLGAGGNANNPIAGKSFYIDATRDVARLANTYRDQGKTEDAALLERISRQPGTTWLTGPHDGDPEANMDIAEVSRTSAASAAQGKIAVYQLYAIPNRDACADYSKAGFKNREDYLRWIERITGALKGDAIFSVEADAVAHAVAGNCMSESEISERYGILSAALGKLQGKPHVLATYLDAGQADWLPDSSKLTGPLKQAGIDKARGVAVNVSSFVATDKITVWSQQLTDALGGDKGVLIDTSRNGRGSVSDDVKGDARWCNPSGRGIGPAPTTKVSDRNIDAYMYIKNIGESDGDCNGYPSAGTFVPSLALEMARNANQ